MSTHMSMHMSMHRSMHMSVHMSMHKDMCMHVCIHEGAGKKMEGFGSAPMPKPQPDNNLGTHVLMADSVWPMYLWPM